MAGVGGFCDVNTEKEASGVKSGRPSDKVCVPHPEAGSGSRGATEGF